MHRRSAWFYVVSVQPFLLHYSQSSHTIIYHKVSNKISLLNLSHTYFVLFWQILQEDSVGVVKCTKHP